MEREQALRDGSLATIIFIRDYNNRGQEVSGYIDLGHRYGLGLVAAHWTNPPCGKRGGLACSNG